MRTIQDLKETAKHLEFENASIMDKYSDEELALIYNGIGPDSWPEKLRDAVTNLNPTLQPVSFIHDIEWHESDKTEEGFKASNERFYTNGKKAAKDEYGWYNPMRYLVMHKAAVFRDLCNEHGWDGWHNDCQCKLCVKNGFAETTDLDLAARVAQAAETVVKIVNEVKAEDTIK